MSWLMWLAVIVLVIAAIVAKVRRAGIVVLRANVPGPGHRDDRSGKTEAAAERMLRCDHCSVYIPESEAIRRGDGVFCCHEHGLRHFPH